MKKIFKTLAVLAAVAALGFGFVSCGNPEDDNDGSRIPAGTSIGSSGIVENEEIPTEGLLAHFEKTDYGCSGFKFYNNNSYIRYEKTNGGYTTIYNKGTYTCSDSFNVGSKITITPTHGLVQMNSSDYRLVTKEELAKIKAEKKTGEYYIKQAESEFNVLNAEIVKQYGYEYLEVETSRYEKLSN